MRTLLKGVFNQMENEKEVIHEITKLNRKMMVGVHERFEKIDSVYGRRLAVIEARIDYIEKAIDTLGKELREQYYSLGRRIELLELQLVHKNLEETKDK